MISIVEDVRQPVYARALRKMFEARKHVFVDLLKWDVPVLDGRFEVDQFDDQHAAYLIVADNAGDHLASARLLKTTRPHILDTLFPELCAGAVPRASNMLEITRFCLAPKRRAPERLAIRNTLVAGLVDYALSREVAAYTGVAELGWLQQILAFGWRCRPLGLPCAVGGRTLGALRIDIDSETPALLAAAGIYAPQALEFHAAREAA